MRGGTGSITITNLLFGLGNTTGPPTGAPATGDGNTSINFSQTITSYSQQWSGTYIGDYNDFNADGTVYLNVRPIWSGTGNFTLVDYNLTYAKIG